MNLTSRSLATLVLLGSALAPTLPAPVMADSQTTPTQTVLPDAYAGQSTPLNNIHPFGPVGAVSDQARRTVLVDSMLKAGGTKVSPQDQAEIEHHLDQVPTDVLQTVAKTGTRILVMQPGQTPEDVGLITPSHENEKLDQPAVQQQFRTAADQAFQAADAKYGPQIKSLQHQLDQARAKADKRAPANPTGNGMGLANLMSSKIGQEMMDPQVQSLSDQLAKVMGQSTGQAWDQLMQTSGLEVEPFVYPQSGNMMADFRASSQGVTLQGIAQEHGAKTPAEMRQFMDQMKALNGSRLTGLQAEMLKTPGLNHKAWSQLPVEQRPFQPGDQFLVPDYYYYRTTDNASETPRILSQHDWDSEQGWKSGDVVGEYYHDSNAIVYQSGHLDRNGEGADTPVHEMGHAYKAALQKLDPQFYPTWDTQWQAHFNDTSQPNRFPTHYSSTNDEEYYAEDFSAWFGGHRDLVTGPDPTGTSLMQQSLQESAHLAK